MLCSPAGGAFRVDSKGPTIKKGELERANWRTGCEHSGTRSAKEQTFRCSFSEARDALMETPPSLPEHFAPDLETARRVIDGAIGDRRGWLDPLEVIVRRLCVSDRASRPRRRRR